MSITTGGYTRYDWRFTLPARGSEPHEVVIVVGTGLVEGRHGNIEVYDGEPTPDNMVAKFAAVLHWQRAPLHTFAREAIPVDWKHQKLKDAAFGEHGL